MKRVVELRAADISGLPHPNSPWPPAPAADLAAGGDGDGIGGGGGGLAGLGLAAAPVVAVAAVSSADTIVFLIDPAHISAAGATRPFSVLDPLVIVSASSIFSILAKPFGQMWHSPGRMLLSVVTLCMASALTLASDAFALGLGTIVSVDFLNAILTQVSPYIPANARPGSPSDIVEIFSNLFVSCRWRSPQSLLLAASCGKIHLWAQSSLLELDPSFPWGLWLRFNISCWPTHSRVYRAPLLLASSQARSFSCFSKSSLLA